MKIYPLAVLAYVAATFVVQAASHFSLSSEHYAAIPHIRKEPIFPLGLSAMLVQGGVLSYLYGRWRATAPSVMDSLRFSWSAGAFLVSYVALAEAAKYTVPAVAPWIRVEIASGFAQFTLYGLLLHWIDRRKRWRR